MKQLNIISVSHACSFICSCSPKYHIMPRHITNQNASHELIARHIDAGNLCRLKCQRIKIDRHSDDSPRSKSTDANDLNSNTWLLALHLRKWSRVDDSDEINSETDHVRLVIHEDKLVEVLPEVGRIIHLLLHRCKNAQVLFIAEGDLHVHALEHMGAADEQGVLRLRRLVINFYASPRWQSSLVDLYLPLVVDLDVDMVLELGLLHLRLELLLELCLRCIHLLPFFFYSLPFLDFS